MLETTHTKSNEQQLKLQETVCAHFRKIATDKNVHVSIVVHPNMVKLCSKYCSPSIVNIKVGVSFQETDESTMMMNSLFGSLKTSQLADNIFIIHRKVFKYKEPYFEKYLQVHI